MTLRVDRMRRHQRRHRPTSGSVTVTGDELWRAWRGASQEVRGLLDKPAGRFWTEPARAMLILDLLGRSDEIPPNARIFWVWRSDGLRDEDIRIDWKID